MGEGDTFESLFFLVEVSLASFFSAAALELAVVLVTVMDSLLLEHDVNMLTQIRAVLEQISVCFISCGQQV